MASIEQQHLPALVGTLAFLAAASLVLRAARQKKKKATPRARRLSFTSVGLGRGTFPPACRVTEPVINAALYFGGSSEDDCPASPAVARAVVAPLLQEYERLARVPDLDRRAWRRSASSGDGPDGAVDPQDLVREVSVEGDEKLVNETILEHCQDCLGAGRNDLPWWEILIIRNRGSGPSACVLRFHHVIGDGLALVAVFEKLLTTEEGKPIQPLFSSKSSSGKQNVQRKGPLSTLWSLVAATVHVLTLAATKYDDDTVFSRINHANMKHSGRRKVVIFPTVPLDFVKRLKAAAGMTVNDVLMAAVSQAIRDYCEAKGDKILDAKGRDLQCRALVPVGFPRMHDPQDTYHDALRNMWCMVSCDMGVGHARIDDRLRHIHAKTTEMKEKPRALMQLLIQNHLGPYVPLHVGQQTVLDTFSRHSAVITNVPGPREACLFAGKKVRNVQLFFDNLVTQVDLVSYAGQVYGNIIFDADQLPDFAEFGRRYAAALEELGRCLDVEVPPDVRRAAQVAEDE